MKLVHDDDVIYGLVQLGVLFLDVLLRRQIEHFDHRLSPARGAAFYDDFEVAAYGDHDADAELLQSCDRGERVELREKDGCLSATKNCTTCSTKALDQSEAPVAGASGCSVAQFLRRAGGTWAVAGSTHLNDASASSSELRRAERDASCRSDFSARSSHASRARCKWPVLVKARGAAADGLVRARSLLSRCRRAAQDSPADRRFPSAGPATGARARLATAAACSQRSALRSAIKKSTRTVDWTISSRCHRCGSGYRSSRKPTPGSLAWPRWCSASRRPRRVPASAERSLVEQGSSCAKRRALRRAMPIIFGVVGMAQRARVRSADGKAAGGVGGWRRFERARLARRDRSITSGRSEARSCCRRAVSHVSPWSRVDKNHPVSALACAQRSSELRAPSLTRTRAP